MALFGKKKKTEKEAPASADTAARVLLKPRLSEKATAQNDASVYVFEVARNASAFAVRDAVKAKYKVTPRKVNIVNRVPRQERVRGRGQTRKVPGLRKAYVYLKKGERIDIV